MKMMMMRMKTMYARLHVLQASMPPPQLIPLPLEYTKLHGMITSTIKRGLLLQYAAVTDGGLGSRNGSTGSLTSLVAPPIDTPPVIIATKKGKLAPYSVPALCLVCGAILDAGGMGQCATHTAACGGDTGVYFLLQECTVLLSHGRRCAYFPSPYVDMYGETHHTFRGKPLLLDGRRYEQLRRIWSRLQVAREVALRRSSETRTIIPGYY